jgi:hypothetical protein
MTDLINPEDLKKQLDEYIKRQQDILDKEMARVLDSNKELASLSVQKRIQKAQYMIEHQPEKPSVIANTIEFLTKERTFKIFSSKSEKPSKKKPLIGKKKS